MVGDRFGPPPSKKSVPGKLEYTAKFGYLRRHTVYSLSIVGVRPACSVKLPTKPAENNVDGVNVNPAARVCKKGLVDARKTEPTQESFPKSIPPLLGRRFNSSPDRKLGVSSLSLPLQVSSVPRAQAMAFRLRPRPNREVQAQVRHGGGGKAPHRGSQGSGQNPGVEARRSGRSGSGRAKDRGRRLSKSRVGSRSGTQFAAQRGSGGRQSSSRVRDGLHWRGLEPGWRPAYWGSLLA